jgi:ABC-type transporter Mla subunit MlaD
MSEHAMRFRLGLFVLLGLVLLGALITLFGGVANFFKNINCYTVIFDNAPGAVPGTPVRRSGVRIGQVKQVALDNDTGKVLVTVEVEAKYTLRHADRPTLVRGLLGGDTSIDFILPNPVPRLVDNTPLAGGETIEGVIPKDVSALVNNASALMPPAKDTLKELHKTVRRFEKMTPLMEETLAEFRQAARATRAMIPALQEVARATRKMIPELSELTKESRKTVPALRQTGEEIQVAARNWGGLGERFNVFLQTNEETVQATLDNLNRTLKGTAAVLTEGDQRNLKTSFAALANVFCPENQRHLAATFRNVRTGTDNLQTISKNTDELVKETRDAIRRLNETVRHMDTILDPLQKAVKPLPESSDRILKNLDQSTDKLNRCLTDLREFLHCLERGDGTLHKLLFDPTLYSHLDAAACAITRALPCMDQILRDLSVFADKLARHPEAIGLGGVIKPSSGLKQGHPMPYYHGPDGH